MKRYLIITVLFLCAGLVSCDKWLQQDSDLEKTIDKQFRDLEGFCDALIGIYSGLGQADLYGKTLTWGMVEMMAQQFDRTHMFSEQEAYTLFPEREAMNYDFKVTAVEKAKDRTWAQAYNLIANANLLLQKLEEKKSALHPLAYDNLKGEALALRALLHMDIIRLFGHGNYNARPELSGKLTIPYETEYSKHIAPQRTYAETYKMLLKDIDEAVELLKNSAVYIRKTHTDTEVYDIFRQIDGSNNFFTGLFAPRINYYGARALQARMHLWVGGDENKRVALEAAEECMTVINSFDYYPFIMRMFRQPYEMAGAVEDNNYLGSWEGFFTITIKGMDLIAGAPFEIKDADSYLARRLTVNKTLLETIHEYNTLGDRDSRFTYLYKPIGYNYPQTSYLPLKLNQQSASAGGIHIIKAAELYYMAAECLVTGPDQDIPKAIGYLDEIRMVRGIDIPLGASTPESAMEEIKKEYMKEFICEGQLFFFYKRMGYSTILNYAGTLTDKQYILPYPDDEILHGNRVQQF